jgi:uncharacterized coiled-coil DUF342 family protein
MPGAEPKEIYEQLVEWKRKRDELNSQVRQSIDELKLLKEERERVNAEVASLKDKRNAKSEEAKELLEEAKRLRESLKGIEPPKGSSETISKLIEKLDFTYQTKPMPFEQEKQLVKKIAELRGVLRTRFFFENMSSKFADTSGKTEALFQESHKFHDAVMDKSKESEKLHGLVLAKAKEVSDLRRRADSAHAQVVQLSCDLSDARSEVAQTQKTEDTNKLIEQEKSLHEKAKKLKQEMTGKKTFNLRDLQVLGAAGEDFDFGEGEKENKD